MIDLSDFLRRYAASKDQSLYSTGRLVDAANEIDRLSAQLAAAVDLARAAAVCIDRLDRMCRGESITDIEACNEAYRMAVDAFKAVALTNC